MFLFIGAGTSTYYEIPDMKGFIELLDKELQHRQLYTDIRQFMGNKPNLEVLMTILSDIAKKTDQFWRTIAPHTSEFLMRSNGFAQKYLERAEALKEAKETVDYVQQTIFKTCIGQVEENINSKVQEVYDELFTTISQSEMYRSTSLRSSGDKQIKYPQLLYIATTNYDAAVERYCELRETQLLDGLQEDPIKKKYRLRTNRDFFNGDKGPVLFKFHGSVNLFRRGVDIYRENVSVYEIEKLGIEGIINKYGDLTLVYPIESTGQEHLTQSPYLDLYFIFRERLVEQTYSNNLWLILGTSLQDTTLCSAMEYALSSKHTGDWPVIILFDRQASITKSAMSPRFEKLKNRMKPLVGEIQPGPDGFGKLKNMLPS